MLVVTWNMGYWMRQTTHEEAWRWLFDELHPDIALLQGCVPPDWACDSGTLQWDRAYPEGSQPWGTTLWTCLPAAPAILPEVDQWLQQLPLRAAGEEYLARAHRLPGWVACAHVQMTQSVNAFVVSIHNPAFEIEPDRWQGLDVSAMKSKIVDDLWLLDVVFYYLRRYVSQPLLVGGDFNYSILFDDLWGPSGNGEFFNEVRDAGFVSLHRRFHDSDQQTFFHKGGHPHQLDYLFADPTLAATAVRCDVVDYSEVSGFSDHAPLIADLTA